MDREAMIDAAVRRTLGCCFAFSDRCPKYLRLSLSARGRTIRDHLPYIRAEFRRIVQEQMA